MRHPSETYSIPSETSKNHISYRELGFEVRLEPVDTEALCAACDGCKDAFASANAVYTRKKPAAA